MSRSDNIRKRQEQMNQIMKGMFCELEKGLKGEGDLSRFLKLKAEYQKLSESQKWSFQHWK